MKKTLLIALTLATVLVYSCKEKEDPEPTKTNNGNNQPQELCDSLAITYDGHIKAIMGTSCNLGGCHATGAGGFMLGTYVEVKTAAEKANFLGAIRHEDGFLPMPSGQPQLDSSLIEQLECWEKSGFPEN